jgi:PBSX family phage terminase large subunit
MSATALETVVRYEPRGAALAMFKNRSAELALAGPAGTGKSLACLFRLHLTALNNPGARFLIVRKTAVSLGSTTLVTFENKVIKAAMAAGIVRWYGGSPREAPCYKYSDGSVIVVGGMDKPEKIMSSEYDMIFADEATELTVDDWEAMGTRLRHGVLPWQQQLAACNPAHPTHWIKQRADQQGLVMLHSRHRDNLAYVNADGSYTPAGQAYMAKLDALTGIRRMRLYEGRWAAAEGLVYEGWDPAVHLVDRLPKGSEPWRRIWGIDFGYSNPFVLQCWAEDPDGRLWLYREMYFTKRLVEDHAKQIKSIVCLPNGAWREPKPRAIVADHDAEDRATFERHFGMSTKPAHKSVSDGIQAMQARLKVQPDGKPRMFVVRDSLVEIDPALAEAKKPTCFAEEIVGYVWPSGAKADKREAPVKEDDHSMDTGRYVVADRDLGARPGIRIMR